MEKRVYQRRKNPQRFDVTGYLTEHNNAELLRKMFEISGRKRAYLDKSRTTYWKRENVIPYEHVLIFCAATGTDPLKWWPELFPISGTTIAFNETA